MKILNLVDLEKSDIKYRIDKFPDGQQQVVIDSKLNIKHHVRMLIVNDPFYLKEHVTIKSRLNNFKDLELIICATQSLRELGVKEIHLYVPYFMGARSDRKFEEGSNNYLKHVICPIINSMGYESVTVLDPHSNVLEACLNRFKKQSIGSFYDHCYKEMSLKPNKFIIVSPDAGALHRVNQAATQMRYKGDIITCTKERDTEGKLTKTIVPTEGVDDSKDFIIIDDICDGGGTFINIGKELKCLGGTGKIYLIVTHGIFSKGLKVLNPYFDGIYTTNSYQNLPMKCEQVGDKIMTVNQLNVF